jgi:hypothetical protein
MSAPQPALHVALANTRHHDGLETLANVVCFLSAVAVAADELAMAVDNSGSATIDTLDRKTQAAVVSRRTQRGHGLAMAKCVDENPMDNPQSASEAVGSPVQQSPGLDHSTWSEKPSLLQVFA